MNPQMLVYRPLYQVLAIILIFLVPLLTMRLLAEEKRSGTWELLFTYPLTDWSIILGKFGAVLLVYLVFLAFTISFSVAFSFMTPVDWGALGAGYLGMVLLGASCLALGLFASSLTENQIIAGVVGFALLLLLWIIGWVPCPRRSRQLSRQSIWNGVEPKWLARAWRISSFRAKYAEKTSWCSAPSSSLWGCTACWLGGARSWCSCP